LPLERKRELRFRLHEVPRLYRRSGFAERRCCCRAKPFGPIQRRNASRTRADRHQDRFHKRRRPEMNSVKSVSAQWPKRESQWRRSSNEKQALHINRTSCCDSYNSHLGVDFASLLEYGEGDGQESECTSNLRGLSSIVYIYAADYSDYIVSPVYCGYVAGDQGGEWPKRIAAYYPQLTYQNLVVRKNTILNCPSNRETEYSGDYAYRESEQWMYGNYGMNEHLTECKISRISRLSLPSHNS